MNGFGHLPNKSDQNTFVFYANASGSISGSFQTWNVPEHATFLHFTVIGGGGGGGGSGITSGASRKGASGGAPGGLVAVSIPAILLPKTLYLQVGFGGAGGARAITVGGNGGNGGNGEISYVCLYPEINPGSVIIQSSQTAAGGGTGGTTSGTSVPAGTAVTLANTNDLKWLGIVGNTVAQTAGGIGSTSAPGSPTYAGLLTGGAGGSGRTTNAGGSINMASISSYITVTVAGGATGTDNPGADGFFSWKPFIATGGGGGTESTNSSLWGGSGGKGAYGCGGGGAGNSLSGGGGSGGYGGAGGDGLIIITIA
jgi:hypothetical protein